MRTDPRLIGFTAYRGHVPLSRLTHVTFSIRRSAVPIKERLHPSSRNSSSEFLRSCSSPSILRRPASPAVGFRSLFATSLERGYVYSQCLPRTASIRPQVFTTSRRFLPLSSLQAYFIPQPRPGSVFVQGLLSRRSHPSSSEGACLHAVAASPLPLVLRLSSKHARVHVRCLSASRPLSAPGRVPQVRLFTSPKAAPLFEFHAPPGSRSLDAGYRSHGRRPLMMLRVRSLRSYASFDEHVRNHLRGTTFRVRPGNHRCSPRAVLQAVARSSRARLSTITFVSSVASRSCTSLAARLTAVSFAGTAGSVTAVAGLACFAGPSPCGVSSSESLCSPDLSTSRAFRVAAPFPELAVSRFVASLDASSDPR